jgi:hypothetical protein
MQISKRWQQELFATFRAPATVELHALRRRAASRSRKNRAGRAR